MRSRLTLLLCCCTVSLLAQRQVKITDAHALDEAPDVRKAKGTEAAIAAAGIMPEQQDLVMTYGDRQYWPAGLRNDSARTANAPYIRNYTAFRVCTYPLDSTAMAVVMVPARDNIHMPEELRPLADFYLVLPEKALQEVEQGKQRPAISRGPRWKDLPQARIIKTDDLYATYDLARDSSALAALAKRGMSPAEIDAVVFRSNETNWPTGINTFERRYARIGQFKKYKAFVGAAWEDKVLLIVPTEKNKGVPTAMRPYVDLYFVYAATGVQVTEKKKRK
jgi:hypothetical protein